MGVLTYQTTHQDFTHQSGVISECVLHNSVLSQAPLVDCCYEVFHSINGLTTNQQNGLHESTESGYNVS